MPKGTPKSKVEKQLDNFKKLESLGIKVPEATRKYLEVQFRIETGVVCLLQCTSCKEPPLELYVQFRGAWCRCGRSLSVIWENPKTFEEILQGLEQQPETLQPTETEYPTENHSLGTIQFDLVLGEEPEISDSEKPRDALQGISLNFSRPL